VGVGARAGVGLLPSVIVVGVVSPAVTGVVVVLASPSLPGPDAEGRACGPLSPAWAAALQSSGVAARISTAHNNRARNTLRGGLTAVTPFGLLVRVPWGADPAESVGARVAEICAGGAGAAVLTKVCATALVTGAVVGGVAGSPSSGIDDERAGTDRPEARRKAAAPTAPGESTRPEAVRLVESRSEAESHRRDDRRGHRREHTTEDRRDRGGGDKRRQEENDRSGSNSGGSSGSGSSGSGPNGSGPSGSGSGGSGSSGSGSSSAGPSGSGSNGSGSSGSASSGSGPGGSGSSGSDSG